MAIFNGQVRAGCYGSPPFVSLSGLDHTQQKCVHAAGALVLTGICWYPRGYCTTLSWLDSCVCALRDEPNPQL